MRQGRLLTPRSAALHARGVVVGVLLLGVAAAGFGGAAGGGVAGGGAAEHAVSVKATSSATADSPAALGRGRDDELTATRLLFGTPGTPIGLPST